MGLCGDAIETRFEGSGEFIDIRRNLKAEIIIQLKL